MNCHILCKDSSDRCDVTPSCSSLRFLHWLRPGGLSGLILGIRRVVVLHVRRCTRCYACYKALLRMYKYQRVSCRHGRRHFVFPASYYVENGGTEGLTYIHTAWPRVGNGAIPIVPGVAGFKNFPEPVSTYSLIHSWKIINNLMSWNTMWVHDWVLFLRIFCLFETRNDEVYC